MGNINNKIETKIDIKTLQKGGGHEKWQLVRFYQTLIGEISKYLLISDENVKMQYYRNSRANKIFDIFSINIEIVRHMMGNTVNNSGHWWLHFSSIPRGFELFNNIIMVKMGWLWNPRHRPVMRQALENGLLTFDLLYIILDNPTRAKNIINKRIQDRSNAPSVSAQNVRNSRRGIETQLQGEANRLNNILYQKEKEKNNAGILLTTAQNNYQIATNDYNKKLNDLNKLKT
jgi:hypothetical protein